MVKKSKSDKNKLQIIIELFKKWLGLKAKKTSTKPNKKKVSKMKVTPKRVASAKIYEDDDDNFAF